jgi:hypothetical protein
MFLLYAFLAKKTTLKEEAGTKLVLNYQTYVICFISGSCIVSLMMYSCYYPSHIFRNTQFLGQSKLRFTFLLFYFIFIGSVSSAQERYCSHHCVHQIEM